MSYILPQLTPLCGFLCVPTTTPPSSVIYMMYGDLTMLVCDTAEKFEITPLLDNLEGQCTHLNGSTVLDQHDTEEEEGGNGKVYPQPLARITTDALPDSPQ